MRNELEALELLNRLNLARKRTRELARKGLISEGLNDFLDMFIKIEDVIHSLINSTVRDGLEEKEKMLLEIEERLSFLQPLHSENSQTSARQ